MAEVFDMDFFSTAHQELPPAQSTPIPAAEYEVQIGVDEKALKLEGGTSKDGRPWKRIDVMMYFTNPADKAKLAATHGENPSIRHGLMIDLVEDGGRWVPDFAPNRNVRAGKLLEVTGVRKPGWKWTDLYGKKLKVKVVNKPDKEDPSIMRHEIAAVSVFVG